MKRVPVILFVYKRLEKTKQTLQSLNDNDGANEAELIIYADGAKSVEDEKGVTEVRDYIENQFLSFSKFRIVRMIKQERNKGLANSIIEGVTEVINKYGAAIVVEDDLITAPNFLEYMNEALEYYKNIPEIGAIGAHTPPIKYLTRYKRDVFITRKSECWGWATWKDRWEKVDWKVSDFDAYCKDAERRKVFDSVGAERDKMLCMQMEGKIDSWYIRWEYHLFFNNIFTVHPRISKIRNIGMDGSGRHCSPTDRYNDVVLDDGKQKCKFEMLPVNYKIEKEVRRFEGDEKTFMELAVNKLKRICKKIISFSGRMDNNV